MKKLIALVLSIVCVLFLISCSRQDTKELDITVFTAWLDNEGIVPGMSQSEMMQKMSRYTYNGESMVDAVSGMYYDGWPGGGYEATGENFGFKNDYTVSSDEKTAIYTNSFYTGVPLNGLTLPFEIRFKDTLHDATARLGISQKLPSDFTPDVEADNVMTLYKDERCTLIFRDLTLSTDPITTDVPYELIFTENYTFEYEGGRVSDVTRIVKFSFTSDDNMLYRFDVMVQESYNRA